MFEDVEGGSDVGCSGMAGGMRFEGRAGGGGGAEREEVEGDELRPGGCGTLRDGGGTLAGGSGAARESKVETGRLGTFGGAARGLVGGVGRPGGGGGGALEPASRRGIDGGFPSEGGFAGGNPFR